MGKKLRASEIVGIFLFKKDDRITVENESRLPIVGRGLAAEIVGTRFEPAGIESADRPVTHKEESGFAGEHHIGGCVPGATGHSRIHPVDHLAVLLKGCDHFWAAHRLRAALDESLAEEVDIYAIDHDLEGRGVGPICAAMGDRNNAS